MKKLNIRTLVTGILSLVGCLGTFAQTEIYKDPSYTADERAADLLKRLTLEEKVSLMRHDSPAIPRLGIPEYNWWNEDLHGVARAGVATVFPQTIGMAATFDPEAVYTTFDIVSTEQRAKYNEGVKNGNRPQYSGLTVWTPNINIFRDPRWGRGMETYGEDPYLTSVMGTAVVRGLQGEPNQKYDKLHACAKHFAVHSGPEWNRHKYNAENIDKRDLRETYLPAFKTLVCDAGVKEVMCAYNQFEGEPCCANKTLLRHILRDEWGYDNVVVSDCGAISDFFREWGHLTYPDAKSSGADALLSGTDLECMYDAFRRLPEAMEAGLIKEEDIDVSVYRLLRARFQLGNLFDDELTPWASLPIDTIAAIPHRAQALEMARKSMTLLKNSNNILPLNNEIRKIAVVGPNANDSVMMWANYNGEPKSTVTILDGIRNRFPKAEIIYEKGCNLVDNKNEEYNIPEIVKNVKDADVILFVGGLSPAVEGEEMDVDYPGFNRGDRTVIELPAVQTELMRALKTTGKPLVFVMCAGSAVAIPWQHDQCDAIIDAFYPGEQGGTAVAEVIAGDYNPAGRLPVTFYASTNDLPDFEDYSMNNRTYRFFTGTPLYPFGHGLSYTTFDYGSTESATPVINAGDRFTFSIPVKNTGDREGDEVTQVYVRNLQDPKGPLKSLKAFRRMNFKAGEEKVIDFTLTPQAFEIYNPTTENMEILKGNYEILYGGTSDDALLHSFPLTIN
ncbi:MAG: glycoside hydrolase family 3 protein [Bacteroides sp.]|nr:glycoside hydrolase family 3 protein [Bacteroides sp.]